ncbi:MAG TPA: hypothetical protein VM936_03880, partial [Pyrinomonadaceae bacterium]|nr:hypothetical protein [Pyrinomonadaceae bacterium]
MSLTTLRVSLLALLCLASLNADARAQSPGAQDSAAKPPQESKEQSVSDAADAVKAEEFCARGEALSGQGDTRGALAALGESVKLYSQIYLGARTPNPQSAPGS